MIGPIVEELVALRTMCDPRAAMDSSNRAHDVLSAQHKEIVNTREGMGLLTNRMASMDAKMIEVSNCPPSTSLSPSPLTYLEVSELVHTQLDRVKAILDETEKRHEKDLEANRQLLRQELQDTRPKLN